MPKATWNGQVIADSKEFQSVEGNVYFPVKSLDMKFFKKSDHTSVCPWKGNCTYFNIEVGGKTNANAAFYYKDPKPAAAKIKDHVAFWKGVKVDK
eukprot:CAMPEP_0114529648 /NCGR_PEP_ID=MMETSP0109-20121206/24974_1 /TAXON_ID=29199 /ORGANISM="Chlorarachnion reptans, Strain CCCM449" /LENGTH=94 /DNA_ID=CAMNT_0001712119 /DNA_START=40 /DNA_END=324 /DNA_ORIENTATION=+